MWSFRRIHGYLTREIYIVTPVTLLNTVSRGKKRKNWIIGFCKGNKMMSSVIWCEKNKSKFFKDNKIARALKASTIYSLEKNLQVLIYTKLHEKSGYHLLIIYMKKASQKFLTERNVSTSRYLWFIWNCHIALFPQRMRHTLSFNRFLRDNIAKRFNQDIYTRYDDFRSKRCLRVQYLRYKLQVCLVLAYRQAKTLCTACSSVLFVWNRAKQVIEVSFCLGILKSFSHPECSSYELQI